MFYNVVLVSAKHQQESTTGMSPPSRPSRWSECLGEPTASHSRFPLAIRPTLCLPHCVHKPVLNVSVTALKIGSPVTSF